MWKYVQCLGRNNPCLKLRILTDGPTLSAIGRDATADGFPEH